MLCVHTGFTVKETSMPILYRTLAGLAIAGVGLLAAAGAYTEITRAPDQS
jgi:hypothetical protein